jgi:hypothetical protein
LNWDFLIAISRNETRPKGEPIMPTKLQDTEKTTSSGPKYYPPEDPAASLTSTTDAAKTPASTPSSK